MKKVLWKIGRKLPNLSLETAKLQYLMAINDYFIFQGMKKQKFEQNMIFYIFKIDEKGRKTKVEDKNQWWENSRFSSCEISQILNVIGTISKAENHLTTSMNTRKRNLSYLCFGWPRFARIFMDQLILSATKFCFDDKTRIWQTIKNDGSETRTCHNRRKWKNHQNEKKSSNIIFFGNFSA